MGRHGSDGQDKNHGASAPARDDASLDEGAGVASPVGLYLKASVFLAGAGVMSAEMAAPRLLAPSFGTTQLIWTNIIGTVLAALTLGAFVGGRLADRWPSEKAYARMLLIAGALLAFVPIVSRPVLDAAARGLAERHIGVFLGSLASVCLFFAPPTFVLGMVGPWAVRLAGAGRSDLGRVAGVLSGLGAFGSILGTFVSSLVLLPYLGTRNTLLVTAGVIAATGAWKAFDYRNLKWPARGAAVLLAASLVLLPRGRVKADRGQIYERESRYQYVQVVEMPKSGRRFLLLNEGNCFHSVKPGSGVLTGGYWDYMAMLPALVPEEGQELRVLILGLAAGTMALEIDHFWGRDRELVIDGVEIDPEVVEVGRRFFDMDAIESLRVHVADARPFLASAKGPYDIIIADTYKQPYIPFHMATREFYSACAAKLAPGGIFAANVGAPPTGSEDLLGSFTATMRRAFPHVYRFEVRNRNVGFSNFIYLASRSELDPRRLGRSSRGRFPNRMIRTVQETWQLPHAPPGALVFTDDRSPVELFVHRALYRVATASSADARDK